MFGNVYRNMHIKYDLCTYSPLVWGLLTLKQQDSCCSKRDLLKWKMGIFIVKPNGCSIDAEAVLRKQLIHKSRPGQTGVTLKVLSLGSERWPRYTMQSSQVNSQNHTCRGETFEASPAPDEG